jgi:hypothetical protein
MHEHGPPLASYAIGGLIFLVVLFFRLRRMRRTQRLRLERLWIVPAIFLGLTVLTFSQTPPHGTGWLWVALALVLGGAAGWQRGRAMRITLDPETHELNQAASPAAFLLLLGLIGVRIGLRSIAAIEGEAWHLDAALVTDAVIALALGLFSVQRLEMYIRGRRLLASVRSAGTAVEQG